MTSEALRKILVAGAAVAALSTVACAHGHVPPIAKPVPEPHYPAPSPHVPSLDQPGLPF